MMLREAGMSKVVQPWMTLLNCFQKMSDSAKREAIRRFNLLDKNNPAAIEKFARDIKPSSTWDQLHEAWISALGERCGFCCKVR